MNSIWDWLVVIGAVGQLGLLGAVVYVVLKVKNGPVAKTQRRIESMVEHGETFNLDAQRIYRNSLPRLMAIQENLAKTGKNLEKNAGLYNAVAAGPRELLAEWAKLQVGLGVVKQGIQALGKVGRKSAPATSGKTAKPPRRSLAHRMGLVPPIVERTARFVPWVRYGVETYKALKQQGII